MISGCNTEYPHYQPPPAIPVGITAFKEVYRWDFATQACRQLGRYDHALKQWVELDDCRGCKAVKDVEYIHRGRDDLDRRSGRG